MDKQIHEFSEEELDAMDHMSIYLLEKFKEVEDSLDTYVPTPIENRRTLDSFKKIQTDDID